MTVEPNFLVHQATHLFLTEPIHFQVVQMNKAAFVWIGSAEGKLGDMSASVPPFGSQISAPATTIFGKGVTESSRNLSRRLATKYKQQFFVSLSLQNPDDMLLAFVEKKLTDLLKNIM